MSLRAHAGLIAAFILVFVCLAWNSVFAGPFIYDEADYMYATSRGVIVNAFDYGTLPLPEFLRLGLGLGRDRSQQTTLSETVRRNNDIVFYRHWHGPLLYYYLLPLFDLHASERLIRASTLLFPILTLLATYFGCLWILPPGQRNLGAVVTSALVFWNFAAVKSSELAPHQAYATAFMVCLLLLAKTIATDDRKYWYLTLMAAGLAFATLEVAFVLVLTLLVAVWVERAQLRPDWPFAAKSIAAFAGAIFIVWPGAILKLSFVKAYFFLVYLAVYRKSPWGQISLFDTWRTRLLDNPIDWALLVLCLIAYLKVKDLPTRRLVYPFLIYGCLMLLTVLRIATYSPRYVLPFLQAFDLFIGFILSDLLMRLAPRARWNAALALCVAIAVTTWLEMRAHPTYPEPRPPAVLAAIRDSKLEDKSLLVPQLDLPTLHYYFPAANLRGFREEIPSSAELASAHYDAVLYSGWPVRLEIRSNRE